MPHRHLGSTEYDELTELPTMMYFRRYAGGYVRTAHRFGRDAYIVYFNLENFSSFNENYGFEEGDRLLKLTALAIENSFPGYLLSRFAEDHFFLVCESNDLEEGILEVHSAVRAYGRNANVELKAGIYCVESNVFEVGVACDRAKIACESIAHRYDRVFRWFDEALNWYVERSHYVESHIDTAIEKGWIKIYFQPIVRSISGKVCEFEALARWDDPRYGMLSPMIFIEVLEKAHLIHKLDAYMVRKVCELWNSLSSVERVLPPVSVNLSRLDFELCDVFELVESAAREYDVPRKMLHLEITESALNENPDQLIENLAKFRSAGYEVWLDDFGSGYSSLNTLKDYVFDVVKIDMAFLREFNSKPKSRIIIASMVNMAKQLGMKTLIEGVELPEQFDFLREIGCEFVQGFLVGRPSRMEDNIRRIVNGELVLDEPLLQGYCDKLGAINTLSATPFEFSWEMDFSEDRTTNELMPLAIVERELDEIHIVRSTQRFARVVGDIGFSCPSEFMSYLNDTSHPQARVMRRAMNSAIVSGATESVDLMIDGMHIVIRLRYVVSHGDVDAFLISLVSVAYYSSLGSDDQLSISTQYLYSVYDEVNIVDLASGVVSTIYRGNTVFPSTKEDELFCCARDRFVNDFVHPDDRERCLRYLDLSDVDKRIEASGRNHLAEAFRALGEDGRYMWITSVLVPTIAEERSSVLICVRQANREVVSTMMDEGPISKDLLWDTLLDLVPAGVFWKDADRRFLGVNKNFLDFYDFKSVNDVLGKNDEDMGWHVETDPFKNDEMRVIENGEPVVNARGTCISQGEVHNIVANKVPLRKNGEIVGLLGYFTDRLGENDSQSVMLDGFNRMAATDQLTGVPNLRGLVSSAENYKDSYGRGGPDFVCVVININDMNEFNKIYGRSFGNRILKVVAQRLTRLNGVSGVVSRIGVDKFAILRQVDSNEEAAREAERMVIEVEGIKEIDGIAVDLRCSMGWAVYSESTESGETLAEANARMKQANAGR